MRIELPESRLKNRRTWCWKLVHPCPWGLILTFCLGLCAGLYIFHSHNETSILQFYGRNKQLGCPQRDNFYIFIARQLESLFDYLKGNSAPEFELQLLKQIINLLDPEKKIFVRKFKYLLKPRDVCGEVYTGTGDGPIYRSGFVPDPRCKFIKLPAFESLITVLLLVRGGGHLEESLTHSIAPLRKIYPKLEVVIATDGRAHLSDTTPETRVFFVNAKDFSKPGKLWNQLVEHTFTRYVLVARDVVRLDDLARLPRLIHTLSTRDGSPFAVVGGAVRSPSGRWRAGCLQMQLRHYALRLTRGYYFSAHDCMICDYLEGPFVTKTDVLITAPFNEDLPGAVVFQDWFLQLKQHRIAVAACPDSLFFVNTEKGSERGVANREAWRTLGKAWRLDSVILDSQMYFRFKCDEVGLRCNLPALRRDGLLMAPCCIDQIVNALQDFDNFASNNNLDYEVCGGLALGAVKLQSFLPWDIDVDIIIPRTEIKIYQQKREEFQEKGYNVTALKMRSYTHYFSIKTPNITFDMLGIPRLTVSGPPGMKATRVEINGLWLRSYWNPGLAIRNRYGPGYLTHPLRTTHLRKNMHSIGNWGKCTMLQYPCLNKQPVDGSFYFHTYHQRDKGDKTKNL